MHLLENLRQNITDPVSLNQKAVATKCILENEYVARFKKVFDLGCLV